MKELLIHNFILKANEYLKSLEKEERAKIERQMAYEEFEEKIRVI